MGNFPETDILSAVICYDPCSTFCVSLGVSPDSETIISALPMVSYTENKLQYQNILHQALGGRFARECLPQVFLAILTTTLGVVDNPEASLNWLLHDVARWTCTDLVTSSIAPVELSMSFSLDPTQQSKRLLDIVLNDSFKALNNVNSPIVRYPPEGFSVLLHTAAIADVPTDLRRLALFRRYLYLLSESYMAIQPSQPIPGYSPLAAARAEAVANLLWSDLAMETLECPKDKKDLSPKIPVLISDLQGTTVLNEPALRSLRTIKEFSFLEGEAACWVGSATAAFLHAMVILDTSSGTCKCLGPFQRRHEPSRARCDQCTALEGGA
jgi:hypothetical protein